jgi:hypothetical protein
VETADGVFIVRLTRVPGGEAPHGLLPSTLAGVYHPRLFLRRQIRAGRMRN